ncbi:MAG: hypothetical protein Q9191_004107 [Dirinaria sp. TL-2023a]
MGSQPATPPSVGDKDASAGLLATTILLTVLSIILVGLRFATRIWITKRVGMDDWTILFACAFIRPLQAAIVVLVVSNVVLSLLWLFQCTPHLDKAWNDKMPGKCFSKGQRERIIISQALISIISDFFLSAFPILILRKVQISYRSKIGLCLLMGLGVITGSLSIVRTVLNWQNVAEDPSWDVIPNWYWRAWEVFFGIAAACIPALRPGYKWFVVKIRNGFSKLGSGSSKQVTQSPTAKTWTHQIPPALLKTSKKMTADIPTANSYEEDVLPIQNFEFEPTMRASMEHYPRKEDERIYHPHDQSRHERRERLHIPGDVSTHRPGQFKRLDSEARVGGGLGAKEVEETI